MSSISGSVTLKTATIPFEGGKILRESAIFQTRCLGIIFYLGEFLSKALLFGFCLPVGEWFKERSIEIRKSEDEAAMKLHMDRFDPDSSIEIEEVFNEETGEFERVNETEEKIDSILKELIPEIDQKVGEICKKYKEEVVSPEDLETMVIDIVISLQSPPHYFDDEKVLAQTEPVFYLFISELAKKIDTQTELQTSLAKNSELFLRSIQEKEIISN